MTPPNSDSNEKEDYYALTPDTVLNALGAYGYDTDARNITLNSYENRVYQIGLNDANPVIAKFYRPGRWTNECILEEHEFTQELSDHEIPVVAPIQHEGGETLLNYQGYRFAVYPRRGGHAPEPGDLDQLAWLGRLIGRIHAVGAVKKFEHRPTLDVQSYAVEPVQLLIEKDFIPADLLPTFEAITSDLIKELNSIFENHKSIANIRCHSDCHVGNILWVRDHGPHFVDFDDCRTGPAIQDLWMLLAGSRQEQNLQISEVLDGYTQFFEFNALELRLIEPLRTLRMIHYAGWLAKRWTDPAFPTSFPWFNTYGYWTQFINELKEQMELINSEPLKWF